MKEDNLPAELGEPPAEWVRAATLLTEGRTYRETADELGVTERTLRNWRHSYQWPAAVAAAESEVRRTLLGAALKQAAVLIEAGDALTTRFVLDLFLVKTNRAAQGRPSKTKAAEGSDDPLAGASLEDLQRLAGLDGE